MFFHCIKDYKAMMCFDKATLKRTLATVSDRDSCFRKKMLTLYQSARTRPLNLENLLGFTALSFTNSPHFFCTIFFRWNTSFFSVGVAVQRRPDDSVPRSEVTTCWHLSLSFLPTITYKLAPGSFFFFKHLSRCLLNTQLWALLLKAGP